jgi:uncharacterized membrane protein (DUF2068 family)
MIGVVMAFFHFPLGRALWILVTTLVAAASFIGLWRMRRWGVYAYLGCYAVGVVAFYLFPPEGSEILNHPILLAIVPLIYGAVVLPYWKRLKP